MNKRTVKFKASKGCYIHPDKEYAIVFPVDHPDKRYVSNTKEAITSRVIRVSSLIEKPEEVVEFETENTIYVIDRTQ